MTTENAEAMAEGGLAKSRIEALADGIFAVAMTLLVLDIKMPDSYNYASDAELWRKLVGLEHAFASYLISFLVLGMYWVGHHFQFHYVRRTDRGLLWINLGLLLFISLVPFSTDLLGDNVTLRLPPLIYGVNLLMVSAMFFAHVIYLQRHPQLAAPSLTPLVIDSLKRRLRLFAIVPVISMATAFYSPRLALYLYISLLFLHFVPGRLDRLTASPGARPHHPEGSNKS
jgi:TMEM175 potassium channel family protein